jgi:tryptophan synthase alpha chain
VSRISDKFKQLKKQKEKALITFITAGDPSLRVTEQLVFALERGGADIIELGVPFSDPLADGPTIQASHLRALKKDVSLKDILGLVRKVRTKSQIPIVLMVSYNLVLQYGKGKFIADLDKAGVDGVICPDLPPEEAAELLGTRENLDIIFLTAPTSTDERIKLVAESSSGFIYSISLLGITGTRKSLSDAIKVNVHRLRRVTGKPVAVGFGVSDAKQVSEVSKFADGVIVGSAIVRLIEKNKGKKSLAGSVSNFVSKLKKATYV